MDSVKLANFFASRELEPGPIEVGRANVEIARPLGVPPGTVIWISEWTLLKTAARHPEIGFDDYMHIAETIREGFVALGNRPRTLEICHVKMTGSIFRFWNVCLKATARSEIFVTMCHRVDAKEARRLYRRAQRKASLVRDAKNRPARDVFLRPRRKST